MRNSKRHAGSVLKRVLHVRVASELHKALAIFEAEHGITHAEAIDAALRLLLSGPRPDLRRDDGGAT